MQASKIIYRFERCIDNRFRSIGYCRFNRKLITNMAINHTDHKLARDMTNSFTNKRFHRINRNISQIFTNSVSFPRFFR